MMLFAVAAMTLSMMAVAYSHPHVLPTVRTDLMFSPAGRVTAIQYIVAHFDYVRVLTKEGVPAR